VKRRGFIVSTSGPISTDTTRSGAAHAIRDELHGIFWFIGSIWAVFLITCAFPSLDAWGVTPRTMTGLVGIVTMPFLHANRHHILSNTVPLFVLLALLAGSRANSRKIVIDIILLSGTLLWSFGRYATHIGASSLIFGLIVFLLVSGFLERRPLPLAIAALVGFFYGGVLIGGVMPDFGSHISWDGHLCGAIAGGIVALALTRPSAERSAQGS
jgi:membrane associated rhomboid family serine protease